MIIDIANHTCIDFDSLEFFDGGVELYLPKQDKMPKIEIVGITNDKASSTSFIEYWNMSLAVSLPFSRNMVIISRNI